MSAARPRPRRRSPSVTTPTSGAVGVDDRRHAEALARDLERWCPRAARRTGTTGTASPRCMRSSTRSSWRPSAPAGCSSGEVLGGEAALLEQGDRERVAQRHRRRGARGRREAERTRFLGDADVEHDVGGAAQRRRRRAGDRDERSRRGAARSGRRRSTSSVSPLYETASTTSPRTSMPRSPWLPSPACRKNAGVPVLAKRGGDLAADDARLADAGDDHLAAGTRAGASSARSNDSPMRSRAAARQTRRARRRGRGARGRWRCRRHCGAPPRTTRVERREHAEQRRQIVEPQAGRVRRESARSGSSCTSRKTASTPAATAARASVGTNARSPPDAVPCPPGSCTLWVASNTTGQPVSRQDRQRAHVGHEVVVAEARSRAR